MRTRILFLALLLAAPASAQIIIPNETFLPGQVIAAGPTNANFSTIGDQALNRAGGAITGHITVDANVTIDGADISDYLDGSGRVKVSASAFAFSSTGDTTTSYTINPDNSFILSGVERFALSASGVTVFGTALINSAGKLSAISSTYFASLDGAAVLPGEASIADGALLARLAANETISGQWSFNPGSISSNTPTFFQATWNSSPTTFTGVLVDITNTASAAASAPLDVKLAGASKVNVSRAGKATAATLQVTGSAANNYIFIGDSAGLGSWTPSATASPLPSGMFAWFEMACPVGWTIKSDAANTYNAKLPRGGPTFVSSGGSDTHTHSLDPADTGSGFVSADHSHTWDLASATVDGSGDSDHDLSGNLATGGGSHDHGFTTNSNVCCGGIFGANEIAGNHSHSGTTGGTNIDHTHGLNITDTSRDGGHAHSENFAATASGGVSANHNHNLDIGSFSSAGGSSVPAYVQVVVCRKD